MPHITSNNKRRQLKQYSTNNYTFKCQKKIKAKTADQEKKIKEKIPKIETEDIVAEVFV
tara:strand:- start:1487 stop:1663 length:177 start_codon:yes stop_codon:yes gene_type:complete